MPATVLEATDLSKSYGARAPLFSGLSLRAETGLTAVAGPNGSGKTTLLKVLASLLRPRSGRVSVRRDGRELGGDERRLAVGWAGPDLSFYEDFTARENLAFFRRAAGLPLPDRALDELLRAVGLSPESGRTGTFSTGMRQRLRIAFALLFDPPILLLDEPASNLDADGRMVVQRLVEERRRRGAVIVASNDPRDFPEPEQTVELGRPGVGNR